MHRARLADKAGAEQLKYAVALQQHAPEPLGVIRVVCGMRTILAKADRVHQLVGSLVDVDVDSGLRQGSLDGSEKLGDRLRAQRNLQLPSVAGIDAQNVIDKIECDLQC